MAKLTRDQRRVLHSVKRQLSDWHNLSRDRLIAVKFTNVETQTDRDYADVLHADLVQAYALLDSLIDDQPA